MYLVFVVFFWGKCENILILKVWIESVWYNCDFLESLKYLNFKSFMNLCELVSNSMIVFVVSIVCRNILFY